MLLISQLASYCEFTSSSEVEQLLVEELLFPIPGRSPDSWADKLTVLAIFNCLILKMCEHSWGHVCSISLAMEIAYTYFYRKEASIWWSWEFGL